MISRFSAAIVAFVHASGHDGEAFARAPVARADATVLSAPTVDTAASALGLGLLLGLRHATDADHVVAMTTVVARTRTLKSAAALGALWGLGHSATVLIAGGAIALLDLHLSPRLGLSFELLVSLMLVALGILSLTGATGRLHARAHRSFDTAAPTSPESRASFVDAPPLPARSNRLSVALRPFAIGIVHGLAGSAAAALLVVPSLHTPALVLAYLALFGVGVTAGMVLLTIAIASPAVALGVRRDFTPWIARAAGVASVAFGLFLTYEICVVDGLLGAAPHWVPS